MVDINLIGDDRTGEERTGDEERVDEFTQTSSMDTQELAFEERTETFDTTKTAGFAQRRSYSSIVSTVIILAVIGVLGFGIWYFMFRDSGTSNQANLPEFLPEPQAVDQSEPASGTTEDEPTTEEEVSQPVQQPPPQQEVARIPEPEPQKIPEKTTTSTPTTSTPPVSKPPVKPAPTRVGDFSPSSSQFVMSSRAAIQTVNGIMGAMPTTLNTTLLSYAGGRLRMEYVAASPADAKSFTQQLNQNYGAGSLSVVSEKQVASNGQSMEKVLISGTIASKTAGTQTNGVDIFNITQLKDWMQSSAKQFGLQIVQFDSQQGRFAEGYQKTPILVRVYGSKESLQRFMDFFASENLNVELAKILLVSKDMASFSDDNLMLVMNLFLFQPS
ncbi:MAG TPA: hypothetical protein VGA99_11310 [bacterium]